MKPINREPGARRWYRFGVVAVGLRCQPTHFGDAFAELYRTQHLPHGLRRSPGVARRMQLDVTARGRLWRRRTIQIEVDGRVMYSLRDKAAVLPHLEWAMHWSIAESPEPWVVLHAAAVARGGQAVLLPAASGAGKSTLTAALLTSGWSLLSDELALIDPATARVCPLPKAVCIKHGSTAALGRLGVAPWRGQWFHKTSKGRVGYVPPTAAADRPTPVGLIVLPRYAGLREPCLRPISPTEALMALASQVLGRPGQAADAISHLSRACPKMTGD